MGVKKPGNVADITYLKVPEGIGGDDPGLLLAERQVAEGGAVGGRRGARRRGDPRWRVGGDHSCKARKKCGESQQIPISSLESALSISLSISP